VPRHSSSQDLAPHGPETGFALFGFHYGNLTSDPARHQAAVGGILQSLF
jgi:hypothetical protein